MGGVNEEEEFWLKEFHEIKCNKKEKRLQKNPTTCFGIQTKIGRVEAKRFS